MLLDDIGLLNEEVLRTDGNYDRRHGGQFFSDELDERCMKPLL
jgi:hypothetical protein